MSYLKQKPKNTTTANSKQKNSMEITHKEAVKVLDVFLGLQSIVHKIDELNDLTIMKHRLKRETNRYLNYIETLLDSTLRQCEPEEMEQYMLIVAQIDAVTKDLLILNQPR